jgi:hypothetical protein
MVNCAFCDKPEMLPFKCPYCEQEFCSEHRLPENHKCEAITDGKKLKKKASEAPSKKKTAPSFSFSNEDDFID